MGKEPCWRTQTTSFSVVDAPSTYNVILGCPDKCFSCRGITYHQKMKFPIEEQIGEVLDDQCSAKKCYVEMV